MSEQDTTAETPEEKLQREQGREEIRLSLQGLFPEGVPDEDMHLEKPFPSNYEEFVSWWAGDSVPSKSDLKHGLAVYESGRQARETLRQQRAGLRAAWSQVPAFIRGPFDHKFAEAERHLDNDDRAAALAVIEYAEAPAAYSPEQLAAFDAVKGQMLAGIGSLEM